MPHGILEGSPEPEIETSAGVNPRAFADQYTAILAEHSIQRYALQARPRRSDLSSWYLLTIALGAALALALVYFLDN